jgi:hypothetical protein
MSRFFAFCWFKAAKRSLSGSSKLGRAGKGLRPGRFTPRLEALEDRTVPSTLTVTSPLDDGSSGTLRSKLAAAAPGDTIQFANQLRDQTLILNSQLAIGKNLNIDGLGADKLTISGGGTTRVFNISGASTTVTLANLTIANGRAQGDAAPSVFGDVEMGGGILNRGRLTVDKVNMTGNQVVGTGPGEQSAGGAIANVFGGSLTVTRSTFTANIARGNLNTGSGAILNDVGSNAVIEHSTFTGNLALGGLFGSFGGALGNYDNSDMQVSFSEFTNNQSLGVDSSLVGAGQGGQGGAIDFEDYGYFRVNPATMSVSHSSFTNNQAIGGNGDNAFGTAGSGTGGAIAVGSFTATATAVISDCTFTNNVALGGNGGSGLGGGQGVGGALALYGAGGGSTATVSQSSFIGNRATGGAGGTGGDTAASFGGAIMNASSTLNVSQGTFRDNEAHGGSGKNGGSGENGFVGSYARGGAIGVATNGASGAAPQTTIAQSLFTDNRAIGGDGGAGGSGANGGNGGPGLAGAVGNLVGTMTISDSNLMNNAATGGRGGDQGTGGGGLGAGGGVVSENNGTTIITNALISGNTATGGAGSNGGSGGNGSGGGLYVSSGATLTLTDSMIKQNTATGGAAGSGGTAGLGQGGGVSVASTATASANRKTKVKNNTASTSDDDVFGTLTIVP